MKAKTFKKYPQSIKKRACQLRIKGYTHREIRSLLKISLGSAYEWTKAIKLTTAQKKAIQKRKNHGIYSSERREKLKQSALKHLKPYWKPTPSSQELLSRIINFYNQKGRIPFKREFNSTYREYKGKFGSWNNAIKLAGFQTNPVKFAKKHYSVDGHLCDSLAEKIIDDYLFRHKITHEKNIPYPENYKLTVDFRVNNVFIEYFGLANEVKGYNQTIKRKRAICKKYHLTLLEIYPRDLFSKNKLRDKFKKLTF